MRIVETLEQSFAGTVAGGILRPREKENDAQDEKKEIPRWRLRKGVGSWGWR